MFKKTLLATSMLYASCFCMVRAEEIDFNRDVRPIFNRHCTACHGGVKMAGEVSFVTRNSILPPEGWVVKPSDPNTSLLIERVESQDPDLRMPPPDHGDALSPEEIRVLRRWIEQGAVWKEHWAYEKPEQPLPPEIKNSAWPLQELDRFVLNRLENAGIAPSPEEKPERWLRRATFDLIGVPPTLEERQEFIADCDRLGDAAYTTVVDRLLSAKGFGERWGSVWLDQVRYADSRGLGLDGPRNIWKYRDWVIDAFNNDMPYSDFTVKQIAGDLIPNANVYDRVATAVHRLTQTNEEGGTDDEEFRVAAVLDRVNTIWQTWQGVTFGCVQCHSHPYDPFQHQEFYQFAAFFNNTKDCDLDDDWPTIQAPINPEDAGKATELDRKIEAIKNDLWRTEYESLTDESRWKPVQNFEASTNNDTQLVIESQGSHAEYHTVGTVSQKTQIRLMCQVPSDLERLTAIRLTILPLDPVKARVDSEWGFVLSHFEANWVIPGQPAPLPISVGRVLIDELDPYFDPQESLNSKSAQGFGAYSRINQPRTAAFVLKEPTSIPENARLEVKLNNDVFILSAFPLVARRGHLDLSDDLRVIDTAFAETQTQRRSQIAMLQEQRKEIPSTSVPVMAERATNFSRVSNVFIRGLFLTKGEEVKPATPAVLHPLADGEPVDRLALAKWLVSQDNPLTARVAVNRIWAQLFGVGIVVSEEDFGSSGVAPSNQPLLDYLALRFQNTHGYKFKPFIRELVLSRAYRQSSVIRQELVEADAENRLVARGPRLRLTAEMVRDMALSCSGLISEKQGGPPVRPPIPEGVWQPFVAWDKWESPPTDQPDRYRRSIYTYTKRSIPYPMFATFDAPSREQCSPRRLRSNTPLQALMTLNDQSFIECTTALAKRMANSSSKTADQIRYGFTLVTTREPSFEEVNDLLLLLEKFGNANDSRTGLQAVARVLLNLDETLTK